MVCVSILRFPNEFILGVATSAQQIEGAWDEDGRGESIWDRHASVPGNVEDGSTPRTACDHYHRWREDLALLRWLGVGGYRFSTSWSRVMPTGWGPPNAKGLDFYERLVDALLESGIEPFLTLNHWDMPQTLQDQGGWPLRGICDAFAVYAETVAGWLRDRVRFWATHNEPWCIATLGYEQGAHAPGHRDPQEALWAAHHLLLSHGLGVERIRGLAADAKVGIVLNLSPGRPATPSPADEDAVRQFDGSFNRWYLDPLFHGRYPVDAIADRVQWGQLPTDRLSFVRDGDLDRIRVPLDFLGVNYYGGTVLAAGSDGRPRAVAAAPPEDLTEMRWEIRPSGLLDLLERLARDEDIPPLFVTENGAAFADPSPRHGRVPDPRRVAYLRDHLRTAHEAVRRGIPLNGYFVWTLLDNFEWGHGFTKRFGLYALDPATAARIPKDSAFWYRKTIAARAVDDEEISET